MFLSIKKKKKMVDGVSINRGFSYCNSTYEITHDTIYILHLAICLYHQAVLFSSFSVCLRKSPLNESIWDLPCKLVGKVWFPLSYLLLIIKLLLILVVFTSCLSNTPTLL